MNKQEVNRLLPLARDVLKERFLDKPVPAVYRGYVSTFGAAVSQGSLAAAVAFYSNKNKNSDEDTSLIMDMILQILKRDGRVVNDEEDLFDYVVGSGSGNFLIKQEVLHAAIALKLAMNLFIIKQSS